MDKAVVGIDYESPTKARAVALALAPDNLTSPRGLKVFTRADGSAFEATIESSLELETFIATLDDLLRCLQTAERSLESLG